MKLTFGGLHEKGGSGQPHALQTVDWDYDLVVEVNRMSVCSVCG